LDIFAYWVWVFSYLVNPCPHLICSSPIQREVTPNLGFMMSIL